MTLEIVKNNGDVYMKILRKGFVLAVMLVSLALLVGAVSAAPTVQQVVTPSTISNAGGSFDVTTTVVTDQFTGFGALRFDLPDPIMSGWTISNVVWDSATFPDYVDAAQFKSMATPYGVPAGTYVFSYTVTVANPETVGTYDLVTYYENPQFYGSTRIQDTDQITVEFMINELFNGDVSLVPGSDVEDALDATGLTYDASGGFLNTIGSFTADYSSGSPETSYGWSVWKNSVLTDTGFDTTPVADGDVVEFIYSSYTGAMWEPDLTNVIAKVTINVQEKGTIDAVRDIPYETLYSNAGYNGPSQRTVTVVVDLTVNSEMSSLTLTEILPAGFTDSLVTPSKLDGAIFKPGAADDKVEWLWPETLSAGTKKQIIYSLYVPESLSVDEYTFGASFANAYEVDYCLVTGDETIRITADWNPWNDEDSDEDRKITLIELQEAINCWLKDIPAPRTGAEITTTRMQALVHFWVNNLPMADGIDP